MDDPMPEADPIKYHHVTREELLEFQRDRPSSNEIGARVAAEAIDLMGLFRHWRQRALRSEEAVMKLARERRALLTALSAALNNDEDWQSQARKLLERGRA